MHGLGYEYLKQDTVRHSRSSSLQGPGPLETDNVQRESNVHLQIEDRKQKEAKLPPPRMPSERVRDSRTGSFLLTRTETKEQNYKWYKKVVKDSKPFWLTKALKTHFMWLFIVLLALIYATSLYVVVRFNLSRVEQ